MCFTLKGIEALTFFSEKNNPYRVSIRIEKIKAIKKQANTTVLTVIDCKKAP